MINGVTPSGISGMAIAFKSHYKNLDHITQGERSKFDVHERSFVEMVDKRKQFHVFREIYRINGKDSRLMVTIILLRKRGIDRWR